MGRLGTTASRAGRYVGGVSESPRQPSGEGAFGPPPGGSPWPQPGPAQPSSAPPIPPGPGYAAPQTGPRGYPQPSGAPYATAYPQQSYPGYAPTSPPQYAAGPMPPAYASYVPAQTSPFPVSTFVLLIVSVISLIATGILGIPSAVVSVVAWRRNATDPGACRKLTTTGWIVYAVNFLVGVPLLIWFYIWALSNQ